MPEPLTHVRDARTAALTMPCPDCEARVGEWCWTSPRGLHMRRYHAGVEAAAAARAGGEHPSGPAPAPFQDALAERAAAVRNVALHKQQREHQQRQQQRRAERNRR